MAELKPCPFCGGKSQLRVEKRPPNGFDYTPRCSVPSCAGRLTKKWSLKDVAVYAWNRRVGDDLMERMIDDGK